MAVQFAFEARQTGIIVLPALLGWEYFNQENLDSSTLDVYIHICIHIYIYVYIYIYLYGYWWLRAASVRLVTLESM